MTALIAGESSVPGASAAIRRAVSATLDRMRAERRRDDAQAEVEVCTRLELAALDAIGSHEESEYAFGLALTNAVNAEQEAGRL